MCVHAYRLVELPPGEAWLLEESGGPHPEPDRREAQIRWLEMGPKNPVMFLWCQPSSPTSYLCIEVQPPSPPHSTPQHWPLHGDDKNWMILKMQKLPALKEKKGGEKWRVCLQAILLCTSDPATAPDLFCFYTHQYSPYFLHKEAILPPLLGY